MDGLAIGLTEMYRRTENLMRNLYNSSVDRIAEFFMNNQNDFEPRVVDWAIQRIGPAQVSPNLDDRFLDKQGVFRIEGQFDGGPLYTNPSKEKGVTALPYDL